MNKIIFTFLFLIGIHNTIGAQKRFDFSLISENIVRDYIVSVPTGVAPAEGWPLVIMCHGTGGQGDKFYGIVKIFLRFCVRIRTSKMMYYLFLQ